MDLIYEGALATIVAVAGTDARSGLHGISSMRKTQPFVKTNAGNLVSTLNHLSLHLARSKWQRVVGLIRSLCSQNAVCFSTKDKGFFACKEYVRAESTQQHPSIMEDSSQDTLSSLIASGTRQLLAHER